MADPRGAIMSKFLIASVLSHALSLFAGDMAGSGGDIVVCGQADGQPSGVFAADYFDKADDFKFIDPSTVPGVGEEQAKHILEKIITARLPKEYRDSFRK